MNITTTQAVRALHVAASSLGTVHGTIGSARSSWTLTNATRLVQSATRVEWKPAADGYGLIVHDEPAHRCGSVSCTCPPSYAGTYPIRFAVPNPTINHTRPTIGRTAKSLIDRALSALTHRNEATS